MVRMILLLLALNSLAVRAATSVSFAAQGTPSVVKIMGTCSRSTAMVRTRHCRDEKPCNWMHAEVELESCTTKNSLRDRHMKEKLKVSQSPKAKLCAYLPMTSGPFKGELEISGKKSMIEGTLTVENGKSTLTFSTLLTNHGIEIPNYLGVGVKDEVKIEASF